MNKGLTIEQLDISQKYEENFTITQPMIETFAKATGDYNPIHMDTEFSKAAFFKAPIAHGMLLAGIISRLIGMNFPGTGTIYLSQTLKFLKPVYVGDNLTFRLKVMDIQKERNRVLLETVIVSHNNETVLLGEALVMPPK